MEIYKNTYQIQSLYGGRNLFQYLFVGEQPVLIDSGIAKTPESAIFPFMDKLKLNPQQLRLLVTTHPDLDHQGGNHAIKQAARNAWLACGTADRELIEHPWTLFEKRYNFLRNDHAIDLFPGQGEPSPDAGRACKVDVTFRGGEKIRLGDDWELDVLHVPGHSRGHLALYDARHKAAFVSDAIHGRGCPKATGEMAIPVTYYYVDLYLSTLRYFEALAIDVLYSGHWPVMHGEQVRDFIAESRQTVELLDRAILSSLDRNPGGVTMKELVDTVANAVGDWPSETSNLAIFSVNGHMDRLEELGKIRLERRSHPARWIRA